MIKIPNIESDDNIRERIIQTSTGPVVYFILPANIDVSWKEEDGSIIVEDIDGNRLGSVELNGFRFDHLEQNDNEVQIYLTEQSNQPSVNNQDDDGSIISDLTVDIDEEESESSKQTLEEEDFYIPGLEEVAKFFVAVAVAILAGLYFTPGPRGSPSTGEINTEFIVFVFIVFAVLIIAFED